MAQQIVDVILEGGGALDAAAEVISVVTELDHFESAQSGGGLAFSGRIGVNVSYRDEGGEMQDELVLIPFEGRTPEFDPELTAEVVEIREVHEFDAATRYFRQRVLVRVGAGEPIVPVMPPRTQPAPQESPNAPDAVDAEPAGDAETPADTVTPADAETPTDAVLRTDAALPGGAEPPAEDEPPAPPEAVAEQAHGTEENLPVATEPARTIVWRPFPTSDLGATPR
ncbi:MAG TPA: hypothetical protein VFK80_06535 [Limnochordia bacterium]|nr:hypothetical protein [Limnochordia bacterium]